MTAVRRHHHEGPEIPDGAPHRELAEVRPVHLGFLPREHRPTQIRLRRPTRAEAADDRAKRALRPRIAALFDHRPEAARAKARILRERLVNESKIRVDQPSAYDRLGDGQTAVREHPFHRVVMAFELRCDRADRPLLGVVQAQDRRALVGRYRAMTAGQDITSWGAHENGQPRTTATALGTALARSHSA